MRRIVMGLLLAAMFIWAGAAEDKPSPTMPEDITLTSGRVLRKVEVMGWKGEAVIVRWGGRVETVPFAVIKSLSHDELHAIRAARESAPRAARKSREISGQVFVTTVGAGAYKFAGAGVYLIDGSALSGYVAAVKDYMASARALSGPISSLDADALTREAWLKAMEKNLPLRMEITDADGNYSMTLPDYSADLLVVCLTSRSVGRSTEHNTWVVPVPPTGGRLNLDGTNQL